MIRYETPVHARGIEDGLAARVADPLWLLARQWQFGEFRHEDAASPASIAMQSEVHLLDQWRSAAAEDWQPYGVGGAPLERRVEEHGGGPAPRLRLEGGLRLGRLLAAAGHAGDVAAFASHCPFPPLPAHADATDAAVREVVPDGAVLATALARLADAGTRVAEHAALAAAGPVGSTADELAQVAANWLAWWNARVPPVIPPDQDSWDDHRLEHAFSLRASSMPAVELRATAFPGGRLDWSAVDSFVVKDAGVGDRGPFVLEQQGVPAPARFGGMPAARFWEMEDARFDPGSVDAAPIDLGRLMLVQYATVYGNDWFVVPVRMPVASLSRVAGFSVHDVYGRTTELTAVGADEDGWSLFGSTLGDTPLEPDAERPTSEFFFLAPALAGSLDGPPTDVALLLRDEMANVAWAVEAVVADDQGRPRDRFAEWAAREVQPPRPTDVPAYRVQTEVPSHWFPLVPELVGPGSTRLRLVPLERVVGDRTVALEPEGTLLPGGDRILYEEEVPRSGVELTRAWRHARWHDGSRHLWQARRRATGRGEGSSGLRFDTLEGG